MLTHLISTTFAKEYKERLKEEEMEKRAKDNEKRIRKRLYIGNEHTLKINRNAAWHEWTLFIKMGDIRSQNANDEGEFISHIVVNLHPSFNPSTVTLRKPPFKLTRLGT
jgi:transcription initiation factor IIF auxiliary subunit